MNDWQLVRKDTGDKVILPADMLWVDEFDWSASAQTQPIYSLSGSLIIQTGIKKAGRPITLTGDWAWHTRKTVQTLREWTDIAGLKMQLSHYDGRVFDVIFRLHEAPLQSTEPVVYRVPETAYNEYMLTVRLMTI